MKPEDQLQIVMITLDHPPLELRPNSNTYWRKKQDFKKVARDNAYFLSKKHAGKFKRNDALEMAITFCWTDGRHRDLDNALSALKHDLDGICDGLGINDRQFLAITLMKWVKAPKNEIFVSISMHPMEKVLGDAIKEFFGES